MSKAQKELVSPISPLGSGGEEVRILHFEDDAFDRKLVYEHLRSDGLEFSLIAVGTKAEFLAELDNGEFDLIISDYTLPDYDAMKALESVRKKFSDVPFILVSGTVGEEVAVQSLHQGADDYILKDNMSRLTSSVRRAIREAQARKDAKRMDEKLKLIQRMESIGRLASGVAHDFNNKLAIILLCASSLLERFEEESPARQEVLSILKASEDSASLTRQLLTFGRKMPESRQVININAVVTECDRMLRRIIGEDVKLDLSLDKDLLPAELDPGQIDQVIMNLAVNARDAMPEGGLITISTSNFVADDMFAHNNPPLKPGRYVRLSVKDNGPGIDQSILHLIFDPFFTTKEPGKGTGLGLSMVFGIVEQSGGQILVNRDVTSGAQFDLFFPVTNKAQGSRISYSRNLSAPGSGEILVVEDDDLLRDAIVHLLQNNGYKVVSASNASEAIESLKALGGVDVILTDVVMPKMSGYELARTAAFNELCNKVIYMSGYCEPVQGYDIPNVTHSFVQKPASPMSVLKAVKEISVKS